MTPQRVRLSRARGARKPPGAVNVARPTKWGNPFMLRTLDDGRVAVVRQPARGALVEHGRYATAAEARAAAVDLFERWGAYARHADLEFSPMDAAPIELAGLDLACWCPLDEPCHADVLLAWANPTEVER